MNEAEFKTLMEQLHQEMITRDIPIHARSIQMAMAVLGAQGFVLLCDPNLEPVPGDYTGASLVGHIRQWCDLNYSVDRQCVGRDIGDVVIEIRGDLWCVPVPTIFTCQGLAFACDLRLPAAYERNGRAGVNLARTIKDMPDGLAATLTIEEIGSQVQVIGKAFFALSALELRFFTIPMVNTATDNFKNASDSLMRSSYGSSMWESLQFTEKILKAYLHVKGTKIPRVHELTQLAISAEQAGLHSLDHHSDFDRIQCNPAVRYDEEVSRDKALAAHHSSIRVVDSIVRALMALG